MLSIDGKKSGQEELYIETKTSALFKVIRNNFGVDDDMDGGREPSSSTGYLQVLGFGLIGW